MKKWESNKIIWLEKSWGQHSWRCRLYLYILPKISPCTGGCFDSLRRFFCKGMLQLQMSWWWWQAQRLREEGLVPVAPQNRDVPITHIPGLPPFPARDLPETMQLDPSFSDFLWTFPACCQSTVILINTFQSLEWRVLNALREKVIGTGAVKVSYVLGFAITSCAFSVLEKHRNFCNGQHCGIFWLL